MQLALYISGTRGPGDTVCNTLLLQPIKYFLLFVCKLKTIELLPLAIASYAFHKKTESES